MVITMTKPVQSAVRTPNVRTGHRQTPCPVDSKIKSGNRDILIIGHRGLPDEVTENTLESFLKARQKGANSIELDTVITRDNVVVLMHDFTLNRTTNGRGDIRKMTYAEVSKFRTREGYHVPTLEELFQKLGDKFDKIFVEIKTGDSTASRIGQEVARLIKQYDMKARVVVTSFNLRTLQTIKKIDPEIHLAYDNNGIAANLKHGFDYLLLQHFKLKEGIKNCADKLGFQKVIVWTPNSKSYMQRALANGADGIMTDYPQKLSEIVKKKDTKPSFLGEISNHLIDFIDWLINPFTKR